MLKDTQHNDDRINDEKLWVEKEKNCKGTWEKGGKR
jgi:hypothetical protein